MKWRWPWEARNSSGDSNLDSPLAKEVSKAIRGAQAYANSHGGHITLVSVTEEGVVRVKLSGTCRGCPLAAVTLKLGVEKSLREAVPGVTRVVAD